MSEPSIAEDQRDAVRVLAFAAREFDRVRDLLVRDDEPGEKEVAEAVEADESADEADRGAARKLLGAIGSVAGTAGRLVTGSVHPRHHDWATTNLEDRIDWWVGRFGTAAAALAAVPGLGGKVGQLVGVDDVVGASAQILVVNAVAREMDVTDVGERVAVAGRIVLGHELDADAVSAALEDPDAQPETDAPGEAPKEKKGPLARVGRTAQLLWRVARRIQNLRSDLDNRRKGGLFSRALSNLPVVGALGGFVSERKGISRAADDARSAFGG